MTYGGTLYLLSFRPQRKRSGGIYSSSKNNLRKIKLAAWVDSSTHIRSLGMTCRGVVLFVRTGYNCNVSGTAHRPFPTFSLVGGFFHPHGLYSLRCLAMDHRRYIAWYHSSTRVIFETSPRFCHSDRSVSGVEESTTLDIKPTQDKTSNSGRFLHSISFRSE